MDAKYLAEIKAREQAATPGPWNVGNGDKKSWLCGPEAVISKLRVVADRAVYGIGSEFDRQTYKDMDFIAAARTDIPALVAEAERLTREKEEEIAFKEFNYEMCNQKDLEIATLEKALGLACERIAEYAFCGGTDAMKQKHAKKNIQHFIQQAQEQEADHA